MNKIVFSVIIVSYKNLEIIIECLESIYKYNDIGEQLEIIIVDNSPDYKIYDYIINNYKEVKIIKNKNNGFGQGNNIGVKHSSGNYLLFLNPDTILIESIFGFAIEKFRTNKKLGLFGVKMVDRSLKRNISFYMMDRYGVLASLLTKLFNKLDIFITKKMFIIGANLFVRRDAFIQAGMFDENIFMYNEEPDLTKRILKLNYETSYFKNKSIIHLEGGTAQNNTDALKRKWETELYYSEKYKLNFLKKLRQQRNLEILKKVILLKKVSNNKKDNNKLIFFNEFIEKEKNKRKQI